MIKNRPRPIHDDEALVEVTASPTRCPYCHESCTNTELSAIVCQQCLSRHHNACWHEAAARCASCGSTRALQGSPQLQPSPAEVALVRSGHVREAVDRMQRRCGALENEALWALLQAAGQELKNSDKTAILGLPAWAVVILGLIMIPIIGIIFGTLVA